MKKYFKRLLIAIDQLVNTILGGYPDETISAVCYRKGKTCKVFRFFEICINLLFLVFEKDHCYGAYMSEVNKTYLPKEYKNERNRLYN